MPSRKRPKVRVGYDRDKKQWHVELFDCPSPLAEPFDVVPCESEADAWSTADYILKQTGQTFGGSFWRQK